jgi:hypothetical protein
MYHSHTKNYLILHEDWGGGGSGVELFYRLLFIEKGRKENILGPHDLVKKCLLFAHPHLPYFLGGKKIKKFLLTP